MKKKISVILTTYNIEKYIKDCLLSLINQNFTDYEIIIMDDNSTDSTAAIIEKYEKNFDFIHLYKNSHIGAGELRNKGFKLSKGEYVIFLDGDDIFHEDFLYKMYEGVKTQNSEICVCNSFEFKDNKKNIIKCHAHKKYPYGWAWDKLIKRTLIEQNKISFSSLKSSNDLLFTYTVCFLSKKVVLINDYLVYRRLRDDSLSSTRNEGNVFEALLELKENFDKYNLSEMFENDFKKIALQIIIWHYNSSKTIKNKEIIFKAIKEYEKDFHILDVKNLEKEFVLDFELYKNAILNGSFFQFQINTKLYNLRKRLSSSC